MKKWFLIFWLFPVCAQAFCLQTYNDKNGQSHGVRCSGKPLPEVECSQKGDFYWDGETCREIPVIKSCKAQGGDWVAIQIRHDMSLDDVLGNPEDTLSSGFKNVCLCPEHEYWNGAQCTAASQIAAEKRCRLNVWCEKKMEDINLLITPEALGASHCPQK